MAAPTYLLEFSQDALSDTTPTYTDITAYFLEGNYTRDGGGDLDDPQAGTATFVLDNRDRRFEPEYAAGAYYPNIRPLRRMRLSIDSDVEFTGFVTSWGVGFPGAFMDDQVVVSCVDGRHLLELEALPGLEPLSATTYEEVVSFDLPWGYWRLGEPEGTKLVGHVRKQKVHHHGHTRTVKHKYKRRVTAAEVEGVAGPAGTYKNQPTLGEAGLILGDQDTAVSFVSADDEYARVGPIDEDDDLSRRAISAEAWIYRTDTAGPVVSGPAYGAGGNMFELSGGAFGAASFSVHIGGTEFRVDGTTTIALNTTYHLVGTWDGQTVRIYTNGALEGEATASGRLDTPDPDEFVYISRNQAGQGFNGVIDEVAVYEKALPAETVLGHYIAGSARGWDEELAGDRIQDIVTHDLWATGSVQSGALNVQPQMKHGQTILEELDRTRECEAPNNVFYFSGAGNPVYLGWDFGDASPYNTVQVTYGDAGGSEVAYEDITLVYDEEIYNEATVARDGGDSQVSSDPDSQDEFRLRRFQSSGLILSEDDDAALVADTVIERFSQPELRPEAIVLNGLDSSALTQIRTREPGQLVRVKRRPQGGTAIDRICRIKGKSVTIPRGPRSYPVATLTLTRGFNAAEGTWRLGIVGFTELDGGAVLG